MWGRTAKRFRTRTTRPEGPWLTAHKHCRRLWNRRRYPPATEDFGAFAPKLSPGRGLTTLPRKRPASATGTNTAAPRRRRPRHPRAIAKMDAGSRRRSVVRLTDPPIGARRPRLHPAGDRRAAGGDAADGRQLVELIRRLAPNCQGRCSAPRRRRLRPRRIADDDAIAVGRRQRCGRLHLSLLQLGERLRGAPPLVDPLARLFCTAGFCLTIAAATETATWPTRPAGRVRACPDLAPPSPAGRYARRR